MWRDISSYSRSDTVRTPTTWEISLPGIKICVHRHIDDRGAWFLTSNDIGIVRKRLSATDIDEAKVEAIHMARSRTLAIADALTKVLGRLS